MIVGCSSDDNVGGHPDTGTDVTSDQATTPDRGGGDAKDAGGGDAGDAADGDTSVHPDASEGGDAREAGDSAQEAEAAAPDADAGADAPPDGPNALQQYAVRYAQAFCTGNLRCCTGYPTGYDFGLCVAQQQAQGFEFTLPGDPAAYKNGHLLLDEDAGARCVAALTSVACGTTVTAALNAGMANACYGVFQGTIPVATGGCVDSYECVSGAYCNAILDGGAIVLDAGDAGFVYKPTGVCAAIAADGGSCMTREQCTTATAQPTSFCSAQLTLDAGNCQPLLPDNAGCTDPNGIFYDLACQAELCAAATGTACGGSFPNDNTNGFCTLYADAGGGG
jgi:hypothetical protein